MYLIKLAPDRVGMAFYVVDSVEPGNKQGSMVNGRRRDSSEQKLLSFLFFV